MELAEEEEGRQMLAEKLVAVGEGPVALAEGSRLPERAEPHPKDSRVETEPQILGLGLVEEEWGLRHQM